MKQPLILCLGMLALLLTGCGSNISAVPGTSASGEGFEVVNPAPNKDGQIRILLSYDMEGLSGQDDWRTFNSAYPERFRHGQHLLAGDVNAVIDGLFAGGANAVDVFDQHGSGQPDSIPDLPRELLHPRARHIFMSEAISAKQAAQGNYDALVTVGEHCKTGSGGFAAHTITMGIELVTNGRTITEVELKALQWGQFGVPLIFSTGDDRLAEDLKGLPWIEYVTVKHSTSASTAELRPVAEVHAEMREKAKRAIERLPESKVIRLATPVTITVRAVPPTDLRLAKSIPGVRYEQNSITFSASALDPDALHAIIAISALASLSGHHTLLRESLQESEEGRAVLHDNDERYWVRWMDYESGRWKP